MTEHELCGIYLISGNQTRCRQGSDVVIDFLLSLYLTVSGIEIILLKYQQ
jgi:hypothetical protein